MIDLLGTVAPGALPAADVRIGGRRIAGQGGGKGGSAPSNDANTMRSNARARFIEALGEGPIHGLMNGRKSIMFDGTPILNDFNEENFKGVTLIEHKGYADEGYFHGHNAVESTNSVEVEVKASGGPITRTILDPNVDAVRVIMRIPALVETDSKGGMKRTSVSYAIDVRANQGAWQTVVQNDLNQEKALSPFQIAHRVNLPAGGAPWDVRVRRLTADSTNEGLQNATWWEGYVTLVEGKFTYPFTAAIAMEVNAEEMGTSIPPRTYHVRGLLVNVPSNYDPIARSYIGNWNGTFKTAWTNNPAWVFYDLLVNDRYGLGDFVQPELIDKWSLYQIARYCDQLVPSGYKNGDTGADIMEPRFTYNGVINTKEEAFFVLQSISQAWRGMAYWAIGQIFPTADMPQDPVKEVVPANVIGGEFSYAGTAVKARHSVVLVRWNDPEDHYRPSIEVVIDDKLLELYGWREKTVQMHGCTSRGLAHRYGKWIIDTEQNETETITYSASWDHSRVRPGDIVAVSDPRKAFIRGGGRIVSHHGLTIELDAPFEYNEGQTYQLTLTMPDLRLETRPILAFLDERTVRVASAFSTPALPDAVWSIKGSDIQPRQHRVLTVDETEPNIYRITALFHDPHKFARVEHGIVFEPLPYDRVSKMSAPPTGLAVRETGYVLNGETRVTLTVSWTPPVNLLVRGYLVTVDTPNDGRISLGTTSELFRELPNIEAGSYTFFVQSVNFQGVLSEPARIDYEANGPAGFALPTVTDLRLVDRPDSDEFTGRDLKFEWKNNFALVIGTNPNHEASPHYTFNVVSIYHGSTNQLLRQQRVTAETFTYDFLSNQADCAKLGLKHASRRLRVEVTVSDVFGRTSRPATRTFFNAPPMAIAPTYQVMGSTIFLSYPKPTDPDFAGVVLFASETPGIDVTKDQTYYDGTSETIIFQGKQDTLYYFRIAAYDVFSKSDLNWSSELSIMTLNDGADVDPPEIPTGLKASSTLKDPLGGVGARVRAEWNANTEDDLAGYDLEIRQGSNGSWVSFPTAGTIVEFDSMPNITFQLRVRAKDRAGNLSGFTEIVSHTAARDNTPPGRPTEVTLTPGLTSFWLSWKNPLDEDLNFIEILENTVNDATTATQIATSIGTSFSRTGLPNEVQRFYWLRAVDTSGNKSALTAVVSGTTALLPDAKRLQIVGLVLTPNSPSTNRVSWSGFSIAYGVPNRTPTVGNVAAGNATWTSGALYLYYVEGDTTLRTTTNVTTIFSQSGHPIAVYRGGTDVATTEGKTMIDGDQVLTGAIGARQLVVNDAIITNSVQLKDAVITSAKIVELDAEKLKAGTTISDTIRVGGGGSTLATVQSWAHTGAQDPVGRINAGVTLIDPGRVLISGGTTLAHWKAGPNSTEINGGALAANTIKANSAVIGVRGVTLDGITFDHNNPGPNIVSWTAGAIYWRNDANQNVGVAISAGAGQWTGGNLWIIWIQGRSNLDYTTDFNVANQDNAVILAVYRGGVMLFSSYGRTTIEGGQLKNDSIETRHLKVGAVTAETMSVQSLSSITANVGDVTAGTIRSPNGRVRFDLSLERLLVFDQNGTLRVRLGNLVN